MVKVYKFNNKLVVYLPLEVIKALGLEGEEEMDFFKYNDKSFIFAKKSDVTNMLIGKPEASKEAPKPQQRPVQQPVREVQVQPQAVRSELSTADVAVLKKLDTLRYNQRTVANVDRILNANEKETLKILLKKKAVAVFKSKDNSQLYSIPKNIYDAFLMRKKPGQQQQAPAPQAKPLVKSSAPLPFMNQKMPDIMENDNARKLEKDGYIVLQTESEAAGLSMSLEESIRRGQVLGTRAFNKKFYIVMRPFLEKRADMIVKELKEGDKKVEEIASKTKLDEDAVRAILYLMAENGDVSEKKRDLFSLA